MKNAWTLKSLYIFSLNLLVTMPLHLTAIFICLAFTRKNTELFENT